MSATYIQGFNAGYMIAAHLPVIATGVWADSASPWVKGFQDGRRQYVSERLGKIGPVWAEAERDHNRNPDQRHLQGKEDSDDEP